MLLPEFSMCSFTSLFKFLKFLLWENINLFLNLNSEKNVVKYNFGVKYDDDGVDQEIAIHGWNWAKKLRCTCVIWVWRKNVSFRRIKTMERGQSKWIIKSWADEYILIKIIKQEIKRKKNIINEKNKCSRWRSFWAPSRSLLLYYIYKW